jgi:hypothetical protein
MVHAFPAGLFGAAFLLLRVQAALVFALRLRTPDLSSGLLAGLFALLLLGGCLTRPVAALGCALTLASPLFGAPLLPAIEAAVGLLALALVGPGALSVDAWRSRSRVTGLEP